MTRQKNIWAARAPIRTLGFARYFTSRIQKCTLRIHENDKELLGMRASCQLTLATLPPAGGSAASRPTSAQHPRELSANKGKVRSTKGESQPQVLPQVAKKLLQTVSPVLLIDARLVEPAGWLQETWN